MDGNEYWRNQIIDRLEKNWSHCILFMQCGLKVPTQPVWWRISDIDIWVDFEDEYEDEAIKQLKCSFGLSVDYKYIVKHAIQRYANDISFKNTSILDDRFAGNSTAVLQTSEYIKDDLIESIDVIFDKANVLRLVYQTRLNMKDGTPNGWMSANIIIANIQG